MIKTAALFGGILLAAPVAFGDATDPVVFDNGRWDPYSMWTITSQYDTAGVFEAQIADDFRFDADARVTGLTFVGAYFNPNDFIPPPAENDAFNIIFYADAGGTPTGAGSNSPTSTALATFTVSFPDIFRELRSQSEFGSWHHEFSLDLGGTFVAQPGTDYWVSIQFVGEFPPSWAWSAGQNDNGNPAVLGYPAQGLDYWTWPFVGDRSFQLHGTVGTSCNAADVAAPLGVLDLVDIDVFIASFTTQDLAADIAPPFEVLDLGDVNAFIQSFIAGCP